MLSTPEALQPPFTQAAAAQPAHKPFLIGPRALTYGELRSRIGKLGAHFEAQGLQPGDGVLLAVAEDADFIVLFLALTAHGLVPLVADPGASPREAQLLVAHARPAAFVVDAALVTAWALTPEALDGRSVLGVSRPAKATLLGKLFKRPAAEADQAAGYPGVLDGLAERPLPAEPAAETPAYVIFTSGTTSRPKGVVITHGALKAHLGTLGRQFGYGPDTRLLNALPLHHADGAIQGPVAAFYHGGTIIRPMPFSVQALQPFLDTIYAQRVTHMVAVPTMLALIARFGRGLEDCFKTEDFRFVVSAAARLEAHLWIEFETRFQARVVNVYGLTETVVGSLFCGPDEATRRTGTLGKPVDCRARIVGEGGQDVPPGEEGELWLAGPHLMAGYWLEPEASAAALQDGWLATGDRVRQDADGFYHITGRAKSVIISGGHNVAPEEVAEVLNAHPGVREACVLGVEEPDWGEAVVACVVSDGDVGAEALQRHCHAHLSAYKVPARFVFLEALPKGPSGKVQLEALRGLMAARPDAESDAGGTIAQQVTALAARCFRVAPTDLSPASGPHNTLGWSSLANLEFIVAVEKAFGIAIGTRDVMTLQSLGDAVQIVQRLQQARRAP